MNCIAKTILLLSISLHSFGAEVGTIVNENWTNLSNWTKVGSQTFTVSAGKLSVVGGTPATASFANYYYSDYGNTQYMHWTITDTITVGTINSTSHGVSVGIESNNSFFKTSMYARLALNTANKGKIYVYGSDGTNTTVIDSTLGVMDINTGDVVIFIVTREYDQVTITAINTSSVSYNNSISLLVAQKDYSVNFRPNIGRFAIFANGGTHTMSALNIKVHQVIGCQLLWVGDSRVIGSGSNEANSFVGLFREELSGTVDNYCGGGDRNQDYVATEILTLAPENIIILSSTNNASNGNNAASTANKMHNFINSLTGYTLGVNLFYCDELPRTTYNMSTYSKALKDSLGQAGCIYTYASAMSNSGTLPNSLWFSSDLLHPNNFGYKNLSSVIINQLPSSITRVNKSLTSPSKVYYQNGRVAISNFNFVPNHMLEVVDGSSLTQIRVGNSTTRNGGFIFSKATNQLGLFGGYYNNGNSTNIAAETSGSGISINGGVVAFTYFSGATIGNSVSVSTGATMTNSGRWYFGSSTTPTATIHIKASTSTASTGQIKLEEGSRQTIAENGTINYVANNLEFVETSTVYILAKTLINTATLDFPSTAGSDISDLTITLIGAAVGDPVILGVPNSSVTTTATYTTWVSANDTVTIRFSPKATEDPGSGTFKVSVIKN